MHMTYYPRLSQTRFTCLLLYGGAPGNFSLNGVLTNMHALVTIALGFVLSNDEELGKGCKFEG